MLFIFFLVLKRIFCQYYACCNGENNIKSIQNCYYKLSFCNKFNYLGIMIDKKPLPVCLINERLLILKALKLPQFFIFWSRFYSIADAK